jgi:hypothetical protein
MTQQCPHCGLLNPSAAARCDCGYDFASKTLKSSYALANVFSKRGGEAKVIAEESRAKIRTGIILLAIAGSTTVISLLAGGHAFFWGGATMAGALLVQRGRQERRQRTLDAATRNDLLTRR